jgi:hypothetical protein
MVLCHFLISAVEDDDKFLLIKSIVRTGPMGQIF